MRDGALENDIVVHENTHGMTNRMTGGGTADCLQTVEAAGLGEGMGYLFFVYLSIDCSHRMVRRSGRVCSI